MSKFFSQECLSWIESALTGLDPVTLITALASLITGLATLLLVLEMKRQRAATSKPVLKILPKYTSATLKKDGWAWSEEKQQGRHVNLKFVNFGTGPALNVKVQWVCDFEALFAALKRFDPYDQIDLEHKNSFLLLGNSHHNTELQTNVRFDAIPANKISEPDLLQIPFFYIDGFEKYTELSLLKRPSSAEGEFSTVSIPDFPSIFVDVEFREINGASLKQRFRISMSPIHVDPKKKEQDSESEMSASIEVEEVKVIKKREPATNADYHY